ncbi:MAG: malonyl-CoA decarboxylase family protein, partial [Alphaproteobacteria bacterium]
SYFLNSSRPDHAPNDPVARFHLGNGALLERINLFADASPKAIKQSAGMMVNYLYELSEVEKRHEDYARHQTIHAADTIKQYLKS